MGIICYSLQKVSLSYCRFMAQTRTKAAVEVRLDLCNFEEGEIKDLFSTPRCAKLIATCHARIHSKIEEASQKLTNAILAGADYVDIPVEWPAATKQWLMNLAMNKDCKVIVSYHNYNETDTFERLLEIAEKARCDGADIIKIVTTANTKDDCRRVLKLYDKLPADKLIAFAMGPLGYDSRLSSYAKGAPLFYLSPTRDGSTAPGQPHYFDFLDSDAIMLAGESAIPASKSFAQRAILLASLTEGVTKLYNFDLCDDTAAALVVAESLYAEYTIEGNVLTITGHQNILRDGLKVKDKLIFVGESGLLARLCIPLAGLCDDDVVIAGSGTLEHRRIDDQRSALRKLGLKVEYSGTGYLPAVVRGHLHSGFVELDGSKGSQMISGLLIALTQCEGESMLAIKNMTSEPYLNLTTYIANFFGLEGYDSPEIADLDERNAMAEEESDDESGQIDALDDFDYSSRTYYIEPRQKVTPVIGLEVEKDWSAAAMMMVAGAVAGDITIRKLDPYSYQSDAIIFDLFKRWNIDMVQEGHDTINVRRSIIQPFFFDIIDSPDLFAPLFVLAARAEGDSIIAGIDRLKNKESNRAVTFAREFRKLGVQTRIDGDEMTIVGHENRRFNAAQCSAHGDHRLAMALHIASLFADGPVEIEDQDCVTKSFPDFFNTIKKLKK